MIKEFTKTFQLTANISIDLHTKIYGLDCKIYYPKSTNHYSGRHDDISYEEVPDEELRLLIPEIYDTRRAPLGGVSDNLFRDEFTLYAKKDLLLPYLSKIVATSEKLGTFQFLVDNSNAVTTMVDSIYKEVILVPFMSFRNNDIDEIMIDEDLLDDYKDDIEDNEISDDQSITNSVPESERVKYIYKRLE